MLTSFDPLIADPTSESADSKCGKSLTSISTNRKVNYPTLPFAQKKSWNDVLTSFDSRLADPISESADSK